jgi:hypothetical protein
MGIIREQIVFIRSPKLFLQNLERHPRAAFVGLKHVVVISVLYEIAILLWAFGADTVTMPVFLKIPEMYYYFYELIFLIPVFIFTWLLAAAVAYILSKAFGGVGTYDSLLCGFGLAMAVSAYFTLIPDYVQGVLWTTGWVPFDVYQELTGKGPLLFIVWAYMAAYTLAHLYFYTVTIHRTQKLPVTWSIMTALISYFCSFTVWITYMR